METDAPLRIAGRWLGPCLLGILLGNTMRGAGCLALGAVVLGLWLGTPPSVRADHRGSVESELDPKYREWLDAVAPLLSKEERKQFLALTEDYQRDGFIHRFWEARNPTPGTSFNAFKASWERRVLAVREEYGNLTEDRARIKLLNGPPASIYKTNCDLAMCAALLSFSDSPVLRQPFTGDLAALGGALAGRPSWTASMPR
jgi:GWxTD domain-containing protein